MAFCTKSMPLWHSNLFLLVHTFIARLYSRRIHVAQHTYGIGTGVYLTLSFEISQLDSTLTTTEWSLVYRSASTAVNVQPGSNYTNVMKMMHKITSVRSQSWGRVRFSLQETHLNAFFKNYRSETSNLSWYCRQSYRKPIKLQINFQKNDYKTYLAESFVNQQIIVAVIMGSMKPAGNAWCQSFLVNGLMEHCQI